jgi:hypothetical protein
MNHILSSLALLLPGANGPGVSPKLSKAMLERAIALHCTCFANRQQCFATGDLACDTYYACDLDRW